MRAMVSSLSSVNLTTFPHEVVFNQKDAQNIIHGHQVSFALPRYNNRSIISITKYGCTRREENNPTVSRKIGVQLKKLITLGTNFYAVELDFIFIVIDIVQFCGVHCNEASFEERSHLVKKLCESGMTINQKPLHPIQKVQLHSTNNNRYFPPGPQGHWVISSHSNPINDPWKCIVDQMNCCMLVRRKVSFGNTIERFELEQKDNQMIVIEIDTSQFPWMSTQEIIGKVVSLKHEYNRWILEDCTFEQQLSTSQWINSVVEHSQFPFVSRNLFHLQQSLEDTLDDMANFLPQSPSFSPTSPMIHNTNDTYSPTSPQHEPSYSPIPEFAPSTPEQDPFSSSFSPASPMIHNNDAPYSPIPDFAPSTPEQDPFPHSFSPASPMIHNNDAPYSPIPDFAPSTPEQGPFSSSFSPASPMIHNNDAPYSPIPDFAPSTPEHDPFPHSAIQSPTQPYNSI